MNKLLEIKKKILSLESESEKQIKIYNSNINLLIDMVKEKSSINDMDNIQQILKIVVKVDPLLILTNTGPYIYKYKDQIKNKNKDFFISNNFTDDISEFYENNKHKKDRFSENDLIKILSDVKSFYPELTEEEISLLWEILQKLLRTYVRYIIYEKQKNTCKDDIRKIQ